jgi:hypothetical protein
MILLSNASSLITLITGGAQAIAVKADYVDALANGTYQPGSPANQIIAGAGTTTIVGSPVSGAERNCRFMSFRNTDASVTCQVTVEQTDGSVAIPLISVPLQAGYTLFYDAESIGFYVVDVNGNTRGVQGLTGAAGTNGTNGTNAGNTGTATINFGAAPGSNTATVAVTGQTTILTTSTCQAFLMEDTSASYTAVDHQYAALFIVFTCSVPVAGVGFNIDATSQEGMQGFFTVRWIWT